MSTTRHTFYALLTGMLLSTPSSAITLSQTPLFISTSAAPNVMLLMDTSGSMDNVIRADGYDSSVTYEDWSAADTYWLADYENNRLNTLDAGDCADDFVQGMNAVGTKKCLKLPNPSDDGNSLFGGNYLNYLFSTYANNTDLSDGTIPAITRMQVARSAAKDLIDQNPGVRFGAASFITSTGAQIDATCGATDIKTHIDGYRGTTDTPLAKALYDITGYFRGVSSPIQFRCQRSFSIVLTDGLPTNDFLPDSVFLAPDATAGLPNYDGLDTQPAESNYPQYSDGFLSGNSDDYSKEGYSLYLDDIAKFGYDTDMRTAPDNDNSGVSFDDSEFPIQRLETYTVGFALDNQMLKDAAEYGHGQYFTANDATALSQALNTTLEDIQIASKASSAAVATNSTRLDSQTIIYQARFNAVDWTGNLLAFGIDATSGEVNSTPIWAAADKLPPASGAVTAVNRKIFTYDAANDSGIEFDFPADYTAPATGDMTSGMVNALLANAPYAPAANATEQSANQTYGEELVAYLRGDTSSNGTYNSGFRSRASVLGDIVNSDPTYVATRDYGYGNMIDDLAVATEADAYKAFRATPEYQARTPVVYVGANDGMLHAFNAIDGTELFAYVPTTVFPNLPALADANYSHQYYVNASPRASDAYINSVWKTILVGAPGAGGRGIFLLDVTSPGSFSESNVLDEFTDSDDADVGYVLGQPTIARMQNGSYAAIFGNGVNSANHRAVLFILNLNDGSVQKFDTGVGSSTTPNGLGAPIPVDIDGDRTTDYIYAGDLQGNMWKFDVDNTSTGQWKIAYKNGNTPAPLYQARDAGGTPQPITVRPAIGSHPDGGLMVYFGTGQYFASGDNVVPASPPVQTFYGIRDEGTKVSGRSALQGQTIIYEGYDVEFGDEVHDVRAISNTETNYGTKDGWYLDLQSPVNGAEGERVVNGAVLRNGRIIFTTLIPSRDPCGYGGYSWLMEMDAISGARFAYSVFDLDGDSKFTSSDYVQVNGAWVPVSGIGHNEVVSQPVVIDAGEQEHKYVSGSSGDISHVTEKGDYYKGRQSWRQLR